MKFTSGQVSGGFYFYGGGELAEEKTFEREVLDRLITMETKLDAITSSCPKCQSDITAHGIALATLEASSKSAHHRIDSAVDGMYKTAGAISAVVGAIVSGISFLLNYLSQKGGHG